jgi:hypothetical protein
MRCNIFKSIGGGDNRMGTFLMFSQYTEDITKEQSMKSTYRVIPSKFIALNLDIDNFFKQNTDLPLSAHITQDSEGYSMEIGDKTVVGVNNIISQFFQSYFENSNVVIHDKIENDHPSNLPNTWDVEGRSLASELLWRMLQDCGFIKAPQVYSDDAGDFEYFDEVKFIGDINIHSNHKVGSYSYDEIFCHIPARVDEYYYPLMERTLEHVTIWDANADILNQPLNDWTDATYPIDYPLVNRAITWHENNGSYAYQYRIGGKFPALDNSGLDYKPVPRNSGMENVEYKFNAVIVFYDVVYNEPGDEPHYIHRFRPMGIYLSGPVDESNEELTLQNTFTKYVTNNDAYGQGASFGLRIMSRYLPTPNMTSNVIEVESDGGDYETITQAMGGIADAIIDINGICKDQKAMYQSFKDHLAQFRNRRVNVPYIREINGESYWFVNGRNTGQPVYPPVQPQPEPPEPQPEPEYTLDDIRNSIVVEPNEGGYVEVSVE